MTIPRVHFGNKTCIKCKQTKPLREFLPDMDKCIDCNREEIRQKVAKAVLDSEAWLKEQGPK